jgi:hypothetical protein
MRRAGRIATSAIRLVPSDEACCELPCPTEAKGTKDVKRKPRSAWGTAMSHLALSAVVLLVLGAYQAMASVVAAQRHGAVCAGGEPNTDTGSFADADRNIVNDQRVVVSLYALSFPGEFGFKVLRERVAKISVPYDWDVGGFTFVILPDGPERSHRDLRPAPMDGTSEMLRIPLVEPE